MADARLSEAEVARRLPVWIALSDVFLDTELDQMAYHKMAEVIIEAGFTQAEARHIFLNEVAPAFAANLLSVAGEWQGWSGDFVRQRVLATRGSLWSTMLTRWLYRDMLQKEWVRIAKNLSA